MKLPAIDFSELIKLLKSEGKAELKAAIPTNNILTTTSKGVVSHSKIFKEWDNILTIIENEIVPLLSKGCEARMLITPAQKLKKSAMVISLSASEILSFVPGPIGIVCSIINAIVCFSTGNVVGGMFELIGCIPGGKVAGKAGSKLYSKIGEKIIKMVQSNRELKAVIDTSSRQIDTVTKFFEKYGPKGKNVKPDVGYGYGVRAPITPSSLERSLSRPLHTQDSAIQAQREIGKYIMNPNVYGNMGKTNLWPHLGF